MSNVAAYIKQFVVCLNLNPSHASASQGDCDAAAGLAAASEQLPVVGDSKAQTDAQMLLDACQAAQLDAWVLPLALLQEDINCLAGRLAHCQSTVGQHYTYKLIHDLFADVMQHNSAVYSAATIAGCFKCLCCSISSPLCCWCNVHEHDVLVGPVNLVQRFCTCCG